VKLARELARKSDTGQTLYVLDEPTTGLHPSDIEILARGARARVPGQHGHRDRAQRWSVVACADHVIDLGPEGGAAGGRVVAEGTPAAVAKSKTHTGRALAPLL
jgi:excinuclease ABC subunit A